MTDVLLADDPLYKELYDVRREAEVIGNFIDRDVMPEIHELRARAPVHKGKIRELLDLPEHVRHIGAAGRQHYTALTYDACEAAFRDPKRFSSKISHHPNELNELTMNLLEMDGPMHRAYRRTIQPRFLMPEAINWWRQKTIDTIVARLIERLNQGDRAELNIDYCARIPVYTITTAIGMEGADALVFRDAFVKSGGIGRSPPEVIREASATVQRMLLELIADRRREQREDLISFLLNARLLMPGEEPRPLTDREIMHAARLVMVAGGGTSWRQMGITLFALLTHPEQFEQVKADRSLMDMAIEEALRWNPTAPLFYRLIEEDTEFYGVPMQKGGVLELALGAANRDPSRWEDPDAFDIHRPRLTHMAFGLGTHRCLGMNVAQVEMSVGINALLDAFPRLRLDPAQETPFLTGGLEQRGVSGLPVLLK
ncbi:MAG TPA: cytochrome P450 [Novosphingobium sp.]